MSFGFETISAGKFKLAWLIFLHVLSTSSSFTVTLSAVYLKPWTARASPQVKPLRSTAGNHTLTPTTFRFLKEIEEEGSGFMGVQRPNPPSLPKHGKPSQGNERQADVSAVKLPPTHTPPSPSPTRARARARAPTPPTSLSATLRRSPQRAGASRSLPDRAKQVKLPAASEQVGFSSAANRQLAEALKEAAAYEEWQEEEEERGGEGRERFK
uniref:Uncharacterized protein n=1 Tax=Guillardia theta TaxID=55529 RepID=A0A6U5W4J5_GUITH|mmetsp:Transcript_1222/g.3779  ORF Transcript_1222/g.3779 Transcript_1222/m.3779 type:complete len:212 (+) Transcript_1222:87-722(+)